MDVSIILPWTATLQPSLIQSISQFATVFISLLALALGIFNFAWSNWMPGKIIISDPLLYAIQLGGGEPQIEQSLTMNIPLTFLNSGGATRFVQDIRLILRQNQNESKELYFVRRSSSMDSEANDSMAQQFVVEGHKTYSSVFLFHRKPGGFVPSVGICKAVIKVKLDDKKWIVAHEFDFDIKEGQNIHVMYPTYSDPEREMDL
jgi:hypothetical protein